jgi:hypothetical protein
MHWQRQSIEARQGRVRTNCDVSGVTLLADYDAGQKPAAPAVSDSAALENEHEREVNEVASVE